jgi:hypothetical protein
MSVSEAVVLVTGYRGWTDRAAISKELARVTRLAQTEFPGARMCLVQGGCEGADTLAREICNAKKSWRVLTFEVDWSLGSGAGPARNQEMIDDTRPHYALVFMDERSKGTRDCLRRLQAYESNPRMSRLRAPSVIVHATV